MNFIIEVADEVLAKYLSLAEVKESYIKFITFHVAIVMSAYTGGYRANGTISLKRPRMHWNIEGLFPMPITCSIWRSCYPYKKQKIGRVLPLKWPGTIKIKRKPRGLGRRGSPILKRLKSSTFEISCWRWSDEGSEGGSCRVMGVHQRALGSIYKWLSWVTVRPPWKLIYVLFREDFKHVTLMEKWSTLSWTRQLVCTSALQHMGFIWLFLLIRHPKNIYGYPLRVT